MTDVDMTDVDMTDVDMTDATSPVAGRRLGLLLCGHVHPAVRHLGGDYPELYRSLFAPFGFEVEVFDADLGSLPDSTDACDAWITSPARASVNDTEDWIAGAEAFIRLLVAEERPFAGMCFGHQLLARALGGRVERALNGWGVGAQRYEVVDQRPWMVPPADHIVLIASHEDQVMQLPDGADLLARSDHCPNAMFAVGERAIGIQAHPEFSADISLALIDLRVELIGAGAAAQARASLATPLDRDLTAAWIAQFLLRT